MNKHTLHAEQRTQTGRKVKALRKSGKIPSTIYGRHLKSMSLSVDTKEFEMVFRGGGESGLVELLITSNGKIEKHPVLVHSIQRDPVTNFPIHVEFHEVDLKEKVTSSIPLQILGEAPAVTDKLGLLLMLVQSVEVEALPTNLPESIPVDISGLTQVGDEIPISKLIPPEGVSFVADPTFVIARISALVQKEKIEETPIVAEGETAEVTSEPEIISEEKKQDQSEKQDTE